MFSVMSVCPPQVGCSHVTITLDELDITIQGPPWAPAPAPATSTLCVGTLDLYSFSVGKEAQNGTWRTWLLRTDFSENLCRAITFGHIYLRCNTPNYWGYEESNSTINFFFKCTIFFKCINYSLVFIVDLIAFLGLPVMFIFWLFSSNIWVQVQEAIRETGRTSLLL